ncbi:uncharacterized protein LOC142550142 [Primulina tabacum]|uniref:uncharacterized protein LOC142550142 n=1 Tax=Primulina tabacum TaxID=48773 RepID=UPI003F5AA5FE
MQTKAPCKADNPNATEDELAKLEKWWHHDLQAKSYMLASMSKNELQRRFEEAVNAAVIYGHLQELYVERTHPWSEPDLVITDELSTNILLLSLPSSFDGFVVNFNMNKLEANLEELVNMLTSYEASIKKEKYVFFIGSSSGTKKGSKREGPEAFSSFQKKQTQQEESSKNL